MATEESPGKHPTPVEQITLPRTSQARLEARPTAFLVRKKDGPISAFAAMLRHHRSHLTKD